MIKKLMLLTTVTVAAAALSGPAAAHAESAGWTMGGVPTKENAPFTATGTVTVKTYGSTFTCSEHLWEQTTWYQYFTGKGHLRKDITAYTCQRTGVLKTACTGVSEVTTDYPAEAEVEESFPTQNENNGGTRSIEAKSVKFTAKFEGGESCPKEIVAEGDVTLTPNNYNAITNLTVSGELETTLGSAETTGTLELMEGSGTFGIE